MDTKYNDIILKLLNFIPLHIADGSQSSLSSALAFVLLSIIGTLTCVIIIVIITSIFVTILCLKRKKKAGSKSIVCYFLLMSCSSSQRKYC